MLNFIKISLSLLTLISPAIIIYCFLILEWSFMASLTPFYIIAITAMLIPDKYVSSDDL